MSLLDVIKQAGLGAVGATNPVALSNGTVMRVNPLEINVDQRFILTEDFLIVPESMTRYEIDLMHTHNFEDETAMTTRVKVTEEGLASKIVIREGLKIGDIVLLLRVQGGQQYVVLDKVVLS